MRGNEIFVVERRGEEEVVVVNENRFELVLKRANLQGIERETWVVEEENEFVFV